MIRTAHSIKVSLCLFAAAFDSTRLGFGPMSLATPLGLDDAGAPFHLADPSFVLEKLGVCLLTRHYCRCCYYDTKWEIAVE